MARYDEITSEVILDQMLNNVRDDVDKRQGSVVYDMTKPAAIELSLIYAELESLYLNGFADTAEGEELERRTSELGIYRQDAVRSRGTVTFSSEETYTIPAGTRLSTGTIDPVYFVTTESVTIEGTATAQAEAEVGGLQGNVNAGEIAVVLGDYSDVVSVYNEEPFEGGADEESDEDLRQRYLLKVQKPITSGNVYHYEQWALEVEGVSDAIVLPTWDGPGTVKVVVIGQDGRAPDQTIVDRVRSNIEDNHPIGVSLTVEAVKEVPIDISATLTLDGDLTVSDIREDIITNVGRYLLDAGNLIRYAQVGSEIIDTDNVLDYSNLTINGGTDNITIDDESVAVVGEVNFNV